MSEMVLNAAEEMSVVDVYDLASDIGKECEKIIDLFGADSVTSLMPKVITVLELLEAMATRNEGENTRVQELHDRIAHLESERQEKAVFRERFEKVHLSKYKSWFAQIYLCMSFWVGTGKGKRWMASSLLGSDCRGVGVGGEPPDGGGKMN